MSKTATAIAAMPPKMSAAPINLSLPVPPPAAPMLGNLPPPAENVPKQVKKNAMPEETITIIGMQTQAAKTPNFSNVVRGLPRALFCMEIIEVGIKAIMAAIANAMPNPGAISYTPNKTAAMVIISIIVERPN
jgi:hypothetical protein